MRLTVCGHDRYFAVEQSLLNYFPKEAEGTAVSRLSTGLHRQTAVTEIVYQGKTAKAAVWCAVGTNPDHILKTSFYRAAKQLVTPPPWGALTGIRPAKKALELMDEGIDPAKALIQRYDVTSEKAKLAAECAVYTHTLRQRLAPKDFSLYIGIPYCPTRCSYCSFISAAAPGQTHLIAPYAEALAEEIRLAGERAAALGLRLRTVYWGGGTPTTLSASMLDELLTVLERSFDMSGLWEHSVEAGRPDTLDGEKLAVLRRHGVGRISVNPQSLEAHVLENIGRAHSPEMFYEAYALAQKAGFAAINTDLIAGLPGDTAAGFARSLDGVLALKPQNITVHTLARKKGSRAAGECAVQAERSPVESMLDYAGERLRELGYKPYYLYRQKFTAGGFENVGWTLPGGECLYNLWMMEELATTLALGAGGVTKLVDMANCRIQRYFQCKYPLDYLARRDKMIGNRNALTAFYENLTMGDVYERHDQTF